MFSSATDLVRSCEWLDLRTPVEAGTPAFLWDPNEGLEVFDPGPTTNTVIHPAALPTAYRVRGTLQIGEPAAGSTDALVELLLDCSLDARSCYAVRFRELTGVRYLSVLRRDAEGTTTLAEAVQGYSFDVVHDISVAVDGARIQVHLDGVPAARANDVHRLRGDAVGLAVRGTGTRLRALTVEPVHDRPLPPLPRRWDPPPVPRDASEQTGPTISNARYRVRFPTRTWSDGIEVTPQVLAADGAGGWVRAAETTGEWHLLTGDYGHRGDLRGTMSGSRLAFRDVECPDEHTAVLTADVPGYRNVSVTWSLRGNDPLVTVLAVPDEAGHHVAVHHAFDSVEQSDVHEVLCGPLQHARMVRGSELLGAMELTAPMALVECRDGKQPWTRGVVVPAQHVAFGDEQNRDPEDQACGLSLRAPDGRVQPTIVVPQYGRRAWFAAGEPLEVSVRVFARPMTLYDAYRELLVDEYGHRAYRRNIFGQSLTDTMHNLIDLLATDPPAPDSVDYQASPSGWWGRAKGYIDIENDQAVRATTTAVLLSASYLTADMDLYDRRARPSMEYHLSRNGYGWTPRPGYAVYSDDTKHELCSTPFGVTALGALHAMTRRRNPAIARLATSDHGSDQDYWLRRAPMCAPLATYRLTGRPQDLEKARAAADDYIAEHIDRAYSQNVDPHDFGIYYSRDWIGLLELYDETADVRYLDAAHREACRFITQVFVRPIHDGTTTVPDRPVCHDRQIELSRWWNPNALYDYPVTDITPEESERWVLSMTGLSFEAVQTYRYSGPSLNPAWAPHLLRLAHRTGDGLMRDVAHNAVIGRYTNYPGYYFRQHTVAPLKPDFPFTGPFDNTTIYYHHAPAQLGMTIDYLLAEHETRCDGAIQFPAEFEENFVWFRFRTYGHRPGTFFGDDDVWLWMPRGVVSLDNSQINWITAHGGTRFYLSLTNSSPETETVTVRFGEAVGMRPQTTTPVAVIDAAGRRDVRRMRGDSLSVQVPGHGLTAVVLHDVGPFDVAMHRDEPAAPDDDGTHVFDDDAAIGPVRGMLLERPDGSGADAYVQSRCATPAVLHYSLDGGRTWVAQPKDVPPAEWTVRLDASTSSFRYHVASDALASEEQELRRPAC